MTLAEPGSRQSLKYKLEGTKGDLGRWGHEFLRSLAGEIGQEYSARRVRIVEAAGGEEDEGDDDGETKGLKAMEEEVGKDREVEVSELIELVDDIVPFHLQHNAEAEAIDLLVEVQVRHFHFFFGILIFFFGIFGMCFFFFGVFLWLLPVFLFVVVFVIFGRLPILLFFPVVFAVFLSFSVIFIIVICCHFLALFLLFHYFIASTPPVANECSKSGDICTYNILSRGAGFGPRVRLFV